MATEKWRNNLRALRYFDRKVGIKAARYRIRGRNPIAQQEARERRLFPFAANRHDGPPVM